MGGRPIEAYTFGNGEKQYLIVAGIHGGYEGNPIALANELITYIIDNPDVIPQDTTLYIIRDMNPDAEVRSDGEDGRVNDHGVDLNRNFPSDNWTADWDRKGYWILLFQLQLATTAAQNPKQSRDELHRQSQGSGR